MSPYICIRRTRECPLSAAQLAVAREYGYWSWPALKAEVERRRLPKAAASPPSPGSQLTPVAVSTAERELADQALWLIELQLTDAGADAGDILRQRCSAALARTAEIQRSGDLDPASQLPDQLTQLCAVLTGHGSPARLPASWSAMLGAARRADGPRHHLDIGAALPLIDGVAVQVDSLISWPDSWRLYLRATPPRPQRAELAPATRGARDVLSDDQRTLTMVRAHRLLHGEPCEGIVTLADQRGSRTPPPPSHHIQDHRSMRGMTARRAFSSDFSITQCDAVCELAGIRPHATATCTQVADGPGLH
jgi:hypothetical protein